LHVDVQARERHPLRLPLSLAAPRRGPTHRKLYAELEYRETDVQVVKALSV
jgi:hypothetical protein